jgi:hypothetical protein
VHLSRVFRVGKIFRALFREKPLPNEHNPERLAKVENSHGATTTLNCLSLCRPIGPEQITFRRRCIGEWKFLQANTELLMNAPDGEWIFAIPPDDPFEGSLPRIIHEPREMHGRV